MNRSRRMAAVVCCWMLASLPLEGQSTPAVLDEPSSGEPNLFDAPRAAPPATQAAPPLTYPPPRAYRLRPPPPQAFWDGVSYRRALNEAYRAGRYDEFRDQQYEHNHREAKLRERRVLSQHMVALREGRSHLRNGDFQRAIAALTLAARLDQGDPVSRIHLAQARLAVGHFPEAGAALYRALQLQPELVYHEWALNDYYPQPPDLERFLSQLRARLAASNASIDEWFLLGAMEMQLGNGDAAHAAFRRVDYWLPQNDLVRAYLEISRPPARVAVQPPAAQRP